MGKIREFATGWGDDYPRTWSNRVTEDLIGSSKGGHLLIPCFRPFDFLAGPNQRLTYLKSASNTVGIDALRGVEPHFHRNVDFDEVFFQWAGSTSYETEYGVFDAQCGDMLLIPAGVAYRGNGLADCLRLSAQVRDPIKVNIGEKDLIGRTEYQVTWEGGPSWPIPDDRKVAAKGRIVESIHTWDDEPGEETLVERAYENMIGVSTEGRPVEKIRLFDVFKEITGRRGPGPVPMENERFVVECYNTVGEQAGFHRGNRNEEFQFQFFGEADNICEFGVDKMESGDLFIVRRGIAHRVIGSRNFRRIVFYSADRWHPTIDPKKPLRHTRFAVREKVVEAASWRAELETA
jgi:oxalate decarboxylase/phosphoglucose isomerase-like protein (cupin superfamily)